LKLKCTGCGEVSEKWHDITESEKFPGKTGRSENNYIAKCKMCGRENCLDIVPGSNGKPNCCIASFTFKSFKIKAGFIVLVPQEVTSKK